MSEYYTPSIEEFHVDFQFQSRIFISEPGKEKVEDWNDHICSMDFPSLTLPMIDDAIKSGDVRVKYLDSDDIQELGFEIVPDNNIPPLPFTSFRRGTIIINTMKSSKGISIESASVFRSSLFNGTIKNKSELQKLLSQLGI